MTRSPDEPKDREPKTRAELIETAQDVIDEARDHLDELDEFARDRPAAHAPRDEET